MNITIRDRLRPFSHMPGASCLIPGSSVVATAFPTRIVLEDLISQERRELLFHIQGPLSEFTLQQDLESDVVWVFGRGVGGFFRFRLRLHTQGVEFLLDKGPPEGIEHVGVGRLMPRSLWVEPILTRTRVPRAVERLSLGNHKAQDVSFMRRRKDLREIVPWLYRLGQKTPSDETSGGYSPLISACEVALHQRDRCGVGAALEALYLAGYQEMLVPRLLDSQFQGIYCAEPSQTSPCFLVSKTATLIRRLFLEEEGSTLTLLPCVPTLFDSGRWVGGTVEGVGEIDFEWSRRLLRRVVLRATAHRSLDLRLPKEVDCFRVRKGHADKGMIWAAGQPLKLETGALLLLDRFQK